MYPSSKPTKDWDGLEALVKKEEKEEKLDGDAALNKFFRDIYSDADEDTRRAMRKSFVESNGSLLSTNWKEVGSKEVEGMGILIFWSRFCVITLTLFVNAFFVADQLFYIGFCMLY